MYFVDLGGSSIWDANEAFYTETPREMIERGDYISPSFNYEPRLNKPVLSYWIVAALYHLFGVSVGVQRFAIAVGGMVMIAAAFFLARTAWPGPRSSAGATLAGIAAALCLAVSPRHVMFARRIFIDIYISMFMALSLLFFALAERFPARRRTFLMLMYVSIGLGVMTKGPVAAVLPGLVFAVYLIAHRELGRLRSMMIPAGVAIVLAIVVPYYVAQYQRHGWTYIIAFVVGENIERYTEGLGVNATRAPWFYIPVLFSDGFPASIFLVAAGACWVHRRRADAGSDFRRVESLLWLWVVVIVGFFSVAAAKQDLYIYPMMPAVAALAGITIARGLSTSEPARRAVHWSIAVAAAVLMVLGAAVMYLLSGTEAVYALAATPLISSVALSGGTLTCLFVLRGRLQAAVLGLCAALAAANWVFVLRTLPSFERYKPAPGFARMLEGRVSDADVVATFNAAIPSLVFYLRRHVDMAYDPAPIRMFLDSPRTAYVIMSRDHYPEIAGTIERPTCIIGAQPTFNVKLRDILSREPVPDLVLVTNRCGPP